ncbi:BsuBI/PstI family type II restriction endonuclease, partial [Bacillus cereus]|uniref:BsuBI/PstI family type II restriction endonuclease n=1 Tax=Bacillus cereus TaxID=1396 RepID=UPI0024923863
HYLPGYTYIFKDADDGDRISAEEQQILNKFNMTFGSLADVWPDVILYNEEKNSLWFIEAVTSDGEVDSHKLKGFKSICKNSNKIFGGCTTTYSDWKKYSN